MADDIFEGCVAAEVGIACNCRYCSFVKTTRQDAFPEGFPEWMKDYRALTVLQTQDAIQVDQEGKINNAYKLAKKVDDDHAVSLPLLDALNKETRNIIEPKVTSLTTRATSLDQQILTNTADIGELKVSVTSNTTAIAANKTRMDALEARIVLLEKKVK